MKDQSSMLGLYFKYWTLIAQLPATKCLHKRNMSCCDTISVRLGENIVVFCNRLNGHASHFIC